MKHSKKNQKATPASSNIAPTLLIGLCVLCFAGCGIDSIDDDGFGRVRSTGGYGAIDGISGFVHVLKSRGLST